MSRKSFSGHLLSSLRFGYIKPSVIIIVIIVDDFVINREGSGSSACASFILRYGKCLFIRLLTVNSNGTSKRASLFKELLCLAFQMNRS